MERRVAIVTGDNRGIGLGVVRQLVDLDYTVVLGSRDVKKGEQAAKRLRDAHQVIVRSLHVTDQTTIDRLRDEISQEFAAVHALVNNAALNYDTWQNAADADLSVVHETLETNLFGRGGCARRSFLCCARAGTAAS